MIHCTPHEERPRERCLKQGPQSLSLRECLAILLGAGPQNMGCMGLAQVILRRTSEGMATAEEERAFFTSLEVSRQNALKEIRGLGPAGQARILAAFELGRRYAQLKSVSVKSTSQRLRPRTLSVKALAAVEPSWRLAPQEWLGFVPFYKGNQVGSLCVVENGVRTHVNTDATEFFARVLALRPVGFFLIHNHPSGDCTPSSEDYELTRQVARLAAEFNILCLGHWVVSATSQNFVAL